MHITHILHRNLQMNANGIAVRCGDRARTWRNLADRVARLAAGLQNLGLGRGDRIMAIAHNSDHYLELYLAVAWLGAVIVPGNTRWSLAEHRFAVDDASPKLLAVDRAFATHAKTLAGAVACPVIFMDDEGAPDGLFPFETLIRDNMPIPDQAASGRELYGIFYTGGTTGRPKGVMLSHDSMMMNALIVNTGMGRYKASSVLLHVAPLFHMAAFGNFMGVSLAGGGNIVLPGFRPEDVIEGLSPGRANAVMLVPTMLSVIVDHLRAHPADLSGVTDIFYGASPISEALLRDALALFPKARFYQGYGQSELGPSATALLPEFHLPDGDRPAMLRSAGRAYMGVDVRVVDERMSEVPRGMPGEVIVRHDGIMLGYWNNPELTAQTIVNGWVRTGDVGHMDDNGFLFIGDRLKDMIISGGENIFSAEVENALAGHAAVLDCAVIGVPDDRWGERVHAIVRLRDGMSVDPQELITHCQALISRYKCPRSIEYRREPFPLSGANKILKRELRAAYEKEAAAE